ncbi:MAG: biotin transporter BioY [Planctomycetota bacterium]
MRSASLAILRPLATVRGRWIAAATLVPALTALGAYVRLPLPGTTVPFTLQTFFVLLFGVLLGARASAAGQGLYLALGGLGVPFFTWGSGWSYLAGETGGYLFGFVLGGAIVGLLARRGACTPIVPLALALTAGATTILVLGAVHYAAVRGLPMVPAFVQGVLPFLPGEVAKVAAVTATVRLARLGGIGGGSTD